jgi:hypothetical protein
MEKQMNQDNGGENKPLKDLLNRAYGQPTSMPDADSFYKDVRRRIRQQSETRIPWWKVLWGTPYRVAAQLACVVLIAMVWLQYAPLTTPTGIGSVPGVAIIDDRAEVEEIDSESTIIVYTLAESQATMVFFSWDDDVPEETHSSSGRGNMDYYSTHGVFIRT